MKLKFILAIVVTLNISSCEKSKNSNFDSKIPKKVINGQSIDKGWCTVDSVVDGMEVVTKVNFIEGNKLLMERLLITNNLFPTAYRFSKNFNYVSYSEYIGVGQYGIKMIQGAEAVQELENFMGQKNIFEKILYNNLNLEKNVQAFSPDKAIILKSHSLLSKSSEDQNFFPCDNYSATFDMYIPLRPMVEFQVLLGNAILKILPQKKLAALMALRLPIEDSNLNSEKLNNTQWCQWFEFGMENPSVTILTVKNTSFRYTTYTDSLDNYEIDSSILQKTAESGQKYSIDKSLAGLKGHYFKDFDGTSFKFETNFKAIKAAEGMIVLAEDKGESDIINSYEIFFDCNDQRPLTMYPGYKKWLKKMMDLEMANL